MTARALFAAALLFAAPAVAAAQITTFIPQVDRTRDSVRAVVVAEEKAVADSVTRAEIADMKTWVDSAAGISAPPMDTTIAPAMPGARPGTPGSTEFHDGARAPDTATSLPLIALFGALALGLGLVLVAPRRKPARVRRGR